MEGLRLKNNEAYGIVNRGGGVRGVELVSNDTASEIMMSKENTNREYEEINI